MPIGSHIQAWRQLRRFSLPTLAEKASLRQDHLEAIEKRRARSFRFNAGCPGKGIGRSTCVAPL